MTSKELIARFFDEEPCEYAANHNGSMYINNGVLYSYGSHFWLARYEGTGKDHVKHFVVNRGVYRHDPRYSPTGSGFGPVRMGQISHTTARQQSDVAKHLEMSHNHSYRFVTEDVGDKR